MRVARTVLRRGAAGAAVAAFGALALTTGTAQASSDYRDHVLATPGVLSYWRLDGSQYVARDEINSPAGIELRLGYLVGLLQPGAIRGDSGTSFRFVHTRDLGSYLTTPGGYYMEGRQAFSLETWLKPGVTNSTSRRIVSRESAMGGYLLAIRSTGLAFARYNLAGTFRSSTQGVPPTTQQADWDVVRSAPLSTTAWSHVVATYDGTTMRLYVNGIPISSAASTISLSADVDFAVSHNPFLVGAGWSGWLGYDGLMDEVAVYGAPLTPEQVLDHYQTGVAP